MNADTTKFIAALFEQSVEGELVDLRMIRKDGSPIEAFIDAHDVAPVVDWALARRDAGNVYVGALPRARDGGGRDAVGVARVVWADCDSPAAGAALDQFPVKPSIVVRSGTGSNVHAYWLLCEPVDLDRVERTNKRLAAALGSDQRVYDAARILRVPGTLNHKHDPPTEVTLAGCSGEKHPLASIETTLAEIEVAAASVPPTIAEARTTAATESPTQRVLSLLREVRESGNGGWKARCPAHHDAIPSLSIAETEDAGCLLHCFAGCPPEAVVQALGLKMSDLFPDGGDAHGGQSLAELLVGIAEDAGVQLFHDSGDTAYARVPVAGHHEVWTLRSRKFKRWLRHELHRREGRIAKTEPLNEAIELLSAKADFDGPETEVGLRSSWVPGGFAYNLADHEGRVVTVTADGWTVEVDGEAAFLRRSSAQPLPIPVAGGSIELLRRYVNVGSDEDFRLIVAWLLMTLRPSGPYPALVILGQQGSAKSTMSRVLKALVDPVKAPVRSLPGSLRDLAIMADSNWVLVMDNLSQLKDPMSDGFCRLATGNGFATRALYTDDEERIFEQMRAVILNGIDAVVTRQDLLGRSIVLRLPKITKRGRRDEETFWADFEADQPKILGALFDAASHALANWDATTVDGLRMADFARWAAAGVPAFGWTAESFIEAYEQNLSGALTTSLEGSIVAAALMGLAKRPGGLPIEGEPTAMRETIRRALTEEEAKSRDFPANAQVMSRSLTLLAPALAEIGIEVITATRGSGKDKSRWITIRATPDDAESGTDGTHGTQLPHPAAAEPSHGHEAATT